jgi:creatinine amidohydrolase/Fe(II)-dependent formamide hydrolase-like protein
MIAAVLLLLTAARPAQATPPDTVFLEELTWTELRNLIQAGKTTIIVPIGGTEQNGPYMALGKHNVRVEHLADEIARGLGNALVAPVLAYVPEGGTNPPTAHMRFPGTITIPTDAFDKLLESTARSFQLHGFRDIVLIGDHGGYQKELVAVANRLNREWAKTPARAHAIVEYYRQSEIGFAQLLRSRGFAESAIGKHAGLADTSLMLAIDPRLVRSDHLRSTKPQPGDGIDGDPREASAGLGQAGVAMIVRRTVEAIREAVARH